SPSSPPPSRAPGSRCAAKTRLASRSAPSSTATRWPSTSNSTSARRPLRSAARPMSSRPRRRLTASTWCAPTCPNEFSAMPHPSALAQVEQAFRSLKTVYIHLRPIFHWTAPRVRGHILLCMLAYHVEHHMRARLAPMLYDETDHEAAAAKRASIVAKAERSDAANRKQTTGRTADGLPVHSFQ